MKAIAKKLMNATLTRKLSGRLDRLRQYDEFAFTKILADLLGQEADRRNLDEPARHYLLYCIQRAMYPNFVIADHSRIMMNDAKFIETFRRYSNDNWCSFERKWNLRELLRLVGNVPGNYAECGVYRGGSAHLLCTDARAANREVHLFDSFEGLSAPNDEESGHWSVGDLSVSESSVRENLKEFDCFRTFKGWIPERFHDVSEERYAFVHIDVDLEQPTYDSLAFFYPRLNPQGVLLLDDHGVSTCPGARRAALDYFATRPESVIDLSTGQGLVVKQDESGRSAHPAADPTAP